MTDNKEVAKEKTSVHKIWMYIQKNGFTILMILFIGLMFIIPDAKSFVLRQFMMTGLFNASIDQKEGSALSEMNTDFSFVDENGNVQHTSSLRGKIVFINFWASWCPPCRAEFPSIEKLYTKFKDNPDIFFLMINEDSDPAVGRAYLDKENLSVPLFSTRGHVPGEIYAGTLPTTVVLDKNGKIRYHHTGFANYASKKFIQQVEDLIKE